MLGKFVYANTQVIDFNDIEVSDGVSYYERLVPILNHGTKKLRNKGIPLVKVQWKLHDEREASWKLEVEM